MIKLDFTTGQARQEVQSFRTSLKQLGAETKLTKKEVTGLETKFKNKLQADKTKEELKKVTREAGLSKKEFSQLSKRLGMTKRQFKDVSREANFAGKSLSKIKSIAKVAALSIAGLSLAAVAFATTVKTITTGAAFEQQMAIVAGVTRATTKEVENLTAAAKEMGATTEFTATQSAEALRFLGMAGLGAVKSIEALPGTIDLATAGALQLGEAADFATNILSGMNLEVSELNRVNDVLVATSTRSNTNIRELAEGMKYVAPVANQLGYSIEQVSALMGTLANSGIKASDAGTDLRQALLRLPKVFKALGVDGEGKGLIDALKLVNEQGWSANKVMESFGLISVKSALALKSSIPTYEKLVKNLKDSKGEAGELAAKMRDTLTGSWKELNSTIEATQLDIFDEYKDSMKSAVKDTTEWIRDHKEELIGTVKIFTDLLTVVVKLVGYGAAIIGLLGNIIGLGYVVQRAGLAGDRQAKEREALLQFVAARAKAFEEGEKDLSRFDREIVRLTESINGMTQAELETQAQILNTTDARKKQNVEIKKTAINIGNLISEIDKEIKFMDDSLSDYELFLKTKNELLLDQQERDLQSWDDHYDEFQTYYDNDIVAYTAWLEKRKELQSAIFGEEVFDADAAKAEFTDVNKWVDNAMKSKKEKDSTLAAAVSPGENYIKFVQAIEKLLTLPQRMVDATTSLLNTISKLGANFKKSVLDFEEALKNALADASEILTQGVVQIFRTLGNLPKILSDGAKEFARELADSIPLLVEEFVKGIGKFFEGLKNELPGLIESVAKSMAKAVYRAILAQFGITEGGTPGQQSDANTKQAIKDLLDQQETKSGQSLPQLLEEFNNLERERLELDFESSTYFEDSLEILQQQYEVLGQIEAKSDEQLRALKEALGSIQNTIGVLSGQKYSLALAPTELARQSALYDELRSAAETGDPAAVQAFADFAVTYLDNFQAMYASSLTYQQEYLEVMEDLRAIGAITQAKIEEAEKVQKQWRDDLLLATQDLYNRASGEEGEGIKVEGINLLEIAIDLVTEAVDAIVGDLISHVLDVNIIGGAGGGYPGSSQIGDVVDIIEKTTGVDIPFLANGAIVKKPTLTMLGEGENDEIVMPLDNFGNSKYSGKSNEELQLMREQNMLLTRLVQQRTNININPEISIDGGQFEGTIKTVSYNNLIEQRDRGEAII